MKDAALPENLNAEELLSRLNDAASQEEAVKALTGALEARVEARTAELREANARLRDEIAAHERQHTVTYNTSEQFRLLVQGVVDYAIYMLDLNGRIATWNAGAERIKGYTAEEALGQHFSMFYTPEARAAGDPDRTLSLALAQGRVEMQGWRQRKDGTRFWASVVVDSVHDADGNLAGFAKVTRDITEQRKAAEALDQAREALFQSQKMEALGQLTGGIAHDFNNILAGILGAINLLERRVEAGRFDEVRKYARVATEAANRAAALTSRLLSYGRRQPLDLKPVDVAAGVYSVEQILRRTIGENITIRTEIDAACARALSDVNQLESALLNFAINARDAMPDGGVLTFAAKSMLLRDPDIPRGSGLAAGEYVVLSVADTGVGMAPEVLVRAFDPFFTTKPIGAGTGLGLSMVLGFAKQSGGHVSIESVEGDGATVRLYLPAAAQEHEPSDEAPRPPLGRGEAILVVEDDVLVRMLILDVLNELGYATLEAPDAQTALPILESERPIDLLISDVGLPGMNGRQLADIATQERPDIKVLFLTGYAEHAAKRSAFLAPGMEMMVKPFSVEELANKIRAMVALREAAQDR